ncbi:MAG: hypothetical protein KKF50_00605 [Nanoarchaeota archaeon]|nr:hypothetical protein [Nanoarchaeota archaeon]
MVKGVEEVVIKRKKVVVKEKDEMSKVIHWAPRILMIIYISMINSFALADGIRGSIKLIPVIFLLIFLGIAWHREIIGGLIILAFGFIFGVFFGAFNSMEGFIVSILPLWFIGILFMVDYKINS